MSKARSSIGTILKFITSNTGYAMVIRQANGQDVARVLDPEVAHKLAETYGVRDRAGGDRRSMKPLVGAACRYRETSQGLLVEVEVLPS